MNIAVNQAFRIEFNQSIIQTSLHIIENLNKSNKNFEGIAFFLYISFSSPHFHSYLHPKSKTKIRVEVIILKCNNFIDFPSWSKAPNICVSYQLGKSCRKFFNLSNNKVNFPLQKVHYDFIRTSSNYFYSTFSLLCIICR